MTRQKLGDPGILAALSTIAGLIPKGWFGVTKWTPTKIGPAMDQFRKLREEGIITEKQWDTLKKKRDSAYHAYKEHHDAWPWDKPKWAKRFKNRVQSFWAYAKKVKASVEKKKIAAKLKSYLPWIAGGGAAALIAGIIIAKKKK